jgi:hypothetical protein
MNKFSINREEDKGSLIHKYWFTNHSQTIQVIIRNGFTFDYYRYRKDTFWPEPEIRFTFNVNSNDNYANHERIEFLLTVVQSILETNKFFDTLENYTKHLRNIFQVQEYINAR